MVRVRALADVDVPAAELERPRHRRLLVLEGRAGQVEVHLVRAGLRLLGRGELDPEPGVFARHEHDDVGVVGVDGQLPAQDTGPEAREPDWVVRIEDEGDEVGGHPLRRYESRGPRRNAIERRSRGRSGSTRSSFQRSGRSGRSTSSVNRRCRSRASHSPRVSSMQFDSSTAQIVLEVLGQPVVDDLDVDLVVALEAQPVDVRRTDRRPGAVHGRGLRVHHRVLEPEDPDARPRAAGRSTRGRASPRRCGWT